MYVYSGFHRAPISINSISDTVTQAQTVDCEVKWQRNDF